MKNPLVDALRQASGSAAPTDQSEPAVEEQVAADSSDAVNESELADENELQLMVSTGVFPDDDAGILPIDGAGILPIDGVGTHPVDGANDAEGDDVDAEFYETGSLQIANDDEGKTVAQPTEPLPYPPPLHSSKRSGVPRLGYYSPLICLAFAVAVAGCYFVYQKITGWHQNSDLAALSSQIEVSAEQGEARTTASQGVESPFKLFVGPQTGSRNDVQAERDNTTASVDSSNTAAAVALLDSSAGLSSNADESEITNLIQRHPESAHLHFALGVHFAEQARWPSARVAFDQALRLDPANADYLFNLAVSLEHLGKYIDARYYYEAALRAANATSTLDNDVVVARIERLTLQSDTEKLVR